MIVEKGVWVHAKFQRIGSRDLSIEVLESDERGPAPPSFQFLGAALKSMHLAMGGAPSHSESLVGTSSPTVIYVPGGKIQQVTIWPDLEDEERITAVYASFMVQLTTACESLVGQFGVVKVELDTLNAIFGPNCTQRESRAVNLFVDMKGTGGLKF